MEIKSKEINKLIWIMLDCASMAEAEQDPEICRLLKLGKFAFSRYIRSGIEEILHLQTMYADYKNQSEYRKELLNDKEVFMMDIFGEEEVESLNDELKGKIKAFVKDLLEKEYGTDEN